MIHYVVGFVIVGDSVLLQLKNRGGPHLKNKLNGVGGKLEPEETFINAMKREYFEETGDDRPINWKLIDMLSENGATVAVYGSIVPVGYYNNHTFESTDPNMEKLFIIPIKDIDYTKCVYNIQKIIKNIETVLRE